MLKPEHKRQSPWQKGKDKSKAWTADSWNERMAPWVEEQQVAKVKAAHEEQVAKAGESKKRKKKNKGRKRAEWFAKQLALWKNFGKEPFEVPAEGTSSSSIAVPPETDPVPPWRRQEAQEQLSFFQQAYKKFDQLLKPACWLHYSSLHFV